MSQTGLNIGSVIGGLALPEPLQVVFVQPVGNSLKVGGKGTRSGQYIERIFDMAQLAQLTVLTAEEPFDGDAARFRLGIEAYRLGLAHEYDPYFSLSIARVDPLPHQITAVYEAMLPRQPLRFLLADDPGAGKTIMAGLLIKELRLRGAVDRILVLCPAPLTIQATRDEAVDRLLGPQMARQLLVAEEVARVLVDTEEGGAESAGLDRHQRRPRRFPSVIPEHPGQPLHGGELEEDGQGELASRQLRHLKQPPLR